MMCRLCGRIGIEVEVWVWWVAAGFWSEIYVCSEIRYARGAENEVWWGQDAGRSSAVYSQQRREEREGEPPELPTVDASGENKQVKSHHPFSLHASLPRRVQRAILVRVSSDP